MVNISDNLFTKLGNVSLKLAVIIKSGFKSKTGFNGARTVYQCQLEHGVSNMQIQNQLDFIKKNEWGSKVYFLLRG